MSDHLPINIKFYSKFIIKPLFAQFSQKIKHNLDLIFEGQNGNELWDFFNFYDRIFEQRNMLNKRLTFDSPLIIFKQKLNELLRSTELNYLKGIKFMEELVNFKSSLKWNQKRGKILSRFRPISEGKENPPIFLQNEFESEYKINQFKKKKKEAKILGEIKTWFRNQISAEQLASVVIFKELEKNFPDKKWKILLSKQKEEIIERFFNLINRLIVSGMTQNIERVKNINQSMESEYYQKLENLNRIEISGENLNLFDLRFQSRSQYVKKNVILKALGERAEESLVDHSIVANFIRKLGSLGLSDIRFLELIFQKNHLLRHQQTMQAVKEKMINRIKDKMYSFEYLQEILNVFDNKTKIIDQKLNNLKSKYRFFYQKLEKKEYKLRSNQKRAYKLLKRYKERFVKIVKLMKITHKHKSDLFTTVFRNLYEKIFTSKNKLSINHVRQCLEKSELISKSPF